MADSVADGARGRRLRDEMLRFAVAGLLGLVVDVTILYGASMLGMGWFAGRALSFTCAVWTTWQFNRHFTFAPGVQAQSAWRQWWLYVSAMLGGGAINYATYSLVMLGAPPVPLLPMAAVAAGSLAGMSVNFLIAKYFVFHRPF